MTVLAYNLANGIKGSWRVVFVPDDLHLMWNSASQTPTQNPADWMSLMISCMAAERRTRRASARQLGFAH
ncbi:MULTISPECIES: hypothetical protein [unclassified Mesorhizobium]|uniref:hypothetical protein n=1 Tax=unclassified Mesorhizobium TaxID=325217 RepID=UPI00333C7660